MPTRSALDPSIRYDDADQEAAQQRARGQDFMFRSYLQNQMGSQNKGMNDDSIAAQERIAMANIADRQVGREFEGGLKRDLEGTFGQKSDMENVLTDKNNAAKLQQLMVTTGPQQTYADLARQKYENESGVSNALNRLKQRFIEDVHGPQGTGGPTALTDRDRRAMSFGLLGLQAPADPEEQVSSMFRQAVAARIPGADPSDIAGLMEAYRSGDPSKIPQPRRAFAEVANRPEVAPMVQQFLREVENSKGQIGSGGDVKGRADYLETLMSGVINAAQRFGADPGSTREALIDAMRQRGLNREDLLVGAAGRLGFGVQREFLDRVGLE